MTEYLAVDWPVVATDLTDLWTLGDVVALTRGIEEFIAAIERP